MNANDRGHYPGRALLILVSIVSLAILLPVCIVLLNLVLAISKSQCRDETSPAAFTASPSSVGGSYILLFGIIVVGLASSCYCGCCACCRHATGMLRPRDLYIPPATATEGLLSPVAEGAPRGFATIAIMPS